MFVDLHRKGANMSNNDTQFVEAVTITVPTRLLKHLALCSKIALESMKSIPQTSDPVLSLMSQTFLQVSQMHHDEFCKILDNNDISSKDYQV